MKGIPDELIRAAHNNPVVYAGLRAFEAGCPLLEAMASVISILVEQNKELMTKEIRRRQRETITVLLPGPSQQPPVVPPWLCDESNGR